MEFTVQVLNNYAIIQFANQQSIVTPDMLSQISLPDPIREKFAHKGVILSGRGPIWLYCFLCHYYHPTKFVATYDPRLQGAVVVQNHGSLYQVGDIIPIDMSVISSV